MLTQAFEKFSRNAVPETKNTPGQVELNLFDAEAITQEEDKKTKVDQSNATSKILTTKEVESLTGINRKKFESRRKNNQLPYSEKGYTVVRWVEKQEKPPYSNMWEVQEASPS